MDLGLQTIKTSNWSADNLENHVTSITCKMYTWAQVTQVGECPFWQLSINHNMDIHKDVHYQVKHTLYMPWTSS